MNEDPKEALITLLSGHDNNVGQSQANIINNIHAHTVIIRNGTGKEPEKITDGQSSLLKRLVYQIGTLERAKNPAYHDANTWTKANNLVGEDHHRDIAKRDFNRVKAYLEGWLRRLQS